MDDAERELLASSTRQMLTATSPGELLDALESLGWFELQAVEPSLAVGTLFEIQGEEALSSSLLDLVMAAELGASPGATIVHALPGKGAAPTGVWATGGFDVEGAVLAVPGPEQPLLLPITQDGKVVMADIAAAPLEFTPIEGIDPWAGWARVTGRVEEAVAVFTDSGLWVNALSAGRRALAHELIGVTRRMLSMAVEHTRTRHQFGRPIGSFQAVQHHLADVHVALESAQVAAAESWADADPWVAVMAKVLAGSAGRTAARQCQQVLGGMGFTWEHPLHRYIRRSIMLDWLLGSCVELEADIGARLLSSRSVPRLVNL